MVAKARMADAVPINTELLRTPRPLCRGLASARVANTLYVGSPEAAMHLLKQQQRG